MRYRNFEICTFTIKTLLAQSHRAIAIFSLLRYTVFRLKVKCHVTHSTSNTDDENSTASTLDNV